MCLSGVCRLTAILSATKLTSLNTFASPCIDVVLLFFFFSSRRRHTRFDCDWSSDVCSSDLEHWLNGEKLLEFDLGTARMDSCLAKSKFRSLPWFGERRRGHIILQDHGDERSEEHTSELQSQSNLVCRLLLEKKKM